MDPSKDSGTTMTPLAPYIQRGAPDGEKIITDFYAYLFGETVHLPRKNGSLPGKGVFLQKEEITPITLDELEEYANKELFFAVPNGKPNHRDGEGYLRTCKYGLALRTSDCLDCETFGDSCNRYHPKVGDQLIRIFPENGKYVIVSNNGKHENIPTPEVDMEGRKYLFFHRTGVLSGNGNI